MKRYVFVAAFLVLFCSPLFGKDAKLETIDFRVLETAGIDDVVINATDSMVKPKMRFDIFTYKTLTSIDDPNKIVGKVEDLVARIVITKTTPTYCVGSIVNRMDGGGNKPNISDISKGMMCRKTTKATLKAEKKIYKYQKKALKRQYKLTKLKAKSGTYEALDKTAQDPNEISSIKAGLIKVEKK
jgi:hypothetical protein